MAADLASLITEIQTAFNDAVGTDDNALAVSTAIATAIDTYAKTLKATGVDVPNGDTHNLSIG